MLLRIQKFSMLIVCICGVIFASQANAAKPIKTQRSETPIIGDTDAACESLNAGQLRFRANRLQVCSRGNWVNITDDYPKVVFLSSTLHTGDLGGVAGADAICQGLADTAGLYGTFKAWISDSESDPYTSFKHSEAPYTLVDETTVADNWTALTSEDDLKVPINMDEYGNEVTLNQTPIPYTDEDNAGAWSATNWDGTGFLTHEDKTLECEGWTNGLSEIDDAIQGMYGLPWIESLSWSVGHIWGCSSQQRLYCFEQ